MSNYTSTSSFWPLTRDFSFQLDMRSDTEMQCENTTSSSLIFIQKPLLSCTTYIPKPSASPCPETPAIQVGKKKDKTGKKRILSVLCRWETDSVVKQGQAVPSESIQDICMTLTDTASSSKPNTYSTSYTSRDLSSGNASKP